MGKPLDRDELGLGFVGYTLEEGRAMLAGMTSNPPLPQPIDHPCIYRGDVIRVQRCDLCGLDKGTDFEVTACSIHGECSLRKLHSRVRGCAGCEDRAEG